MSSWGRLAAAEVRRAAEQFPDVVEFVVTPAPDPRALTDAERRRAVAVILGLIDKGGTSHV